MNYQNKAIRVYYISGEMDSFHHADLSEEPGSDFLFVTVGSKTRKTVLIPKSRVLKMEITDSKEDKDETVA